MNQYQNIFIVTCLLAMMSMSVVSQNVFAKTGTDTYEDQRGDQEINQATLDKAESLFLEGFSLYKKKKYQEATVFFEKAYRLVAHKDLLFNIARSYEQLKNKKECIKWYKAYLATQPIDETSIIHKLKLLGVKKAIKPMVNPSKPQAKTTKKSKPISMQKLLPWVSMGLGVVLVGIGGWQGMNALESAENARNAKLKQKYKSFKEDAEGQALTADITIGLGAVALSIGAYLWYKEYKKNTNKRSYNRISFDVTADRTSLGYSWSF